MDKADMLSVLPGSRCETTAEPLAPELHAEVPLQQPPSGRRQFCPEAPLPSEHRLAPKPQDTAKVSAKLLSSKLGRSPDETPQALDLPLVQFSAFSYYCRDNEPEMVLEVMRIGNLARRSEVRFVTRDVTARAGVMYEFTCGVVVFEPGEFSCSIRVPLIMSDRWDTTLEFLVELLRTDLKSAMLGRYLWQTRVKIIKDDTFPTNRFSRDILKRKVHKVPKWALLFEYFRMSCHEPTILRSTIKTLAFDQLGNLDLVLKLLAAVYTIDFVLNPSVADGDVILGSKQDFLWVCACLVLVPLPLLQWWAEFRKIMWGIRGTLRCVLQKNLLRKFLNYDTKAREALRDGELILSMTHDIDDLVNRGYMNIFVLARSVSQLAVLIVFQFVAPVVFGEKLSLVSSLPMVFLLLAELAWLCWFHKRVETRLSMQTKMLGRLCDHVGETVCNYRLIADYYQRPIFVQEHEHQIDQFNVADVVVEQACGIAASLTPGLMTLFLVIYIPCGGGLVRSGELTLGFYIADICVFCLANKLWKTVCTAAIDMQRSFAPLERLVKLLNLPIDVPRRMKVNRQRRNISEELRKRVRSYMESANGNHEAAAPLKAASSVDLLPIRIANLEFAQVNVAHGRRMSSHDEHLIKPLSHTGSIELAQGEFIVLTGPHGEGKSTLLRLVGDVIVEDSATNTVFVPSHLRVLHVNSEPVLFRGTLFANLCFGVNSQDADARMDRVLAVCRRLGVQEEVLQLIAHDVILPWDEVLSQTQRHLLNIARALIANPEVLCIHKPTLVFNERPARRMMKLLRDFVSSKGIEQDMAQWHLRRPRTCIITCSKTHGIDLADQILHVSSTGGIVKLSHDQLKDCDFEQDDDCSPRVSPSGSPSTREKPW